MTAVIASATMFATIMICSTPTDVSFYPLFAISAAALYLVTTSLCGRERRAGGHENAMFAAALQSIQEEPHVCKVSGRCLSVFIV
jgi:hypothetical protein